MSCRWVMCVVRVKMIDTNLRGTVTLHSSSKYRVIARQSHHTLVNISCKLLFCFVNKLCFDVHPPFDPGSANFRVYFGLVIRAMKYTNIVI
jgi:hypothetical protein